MKKTIVIERNGERLYKGKMQNMPVKSEAIDEKSIELFNDEDPCIIHQSYCMKEFASHLESLFTSEGSDTLNAENFKEELAFLDVDSLDNVIIRRGKK